ncbi:hypothetical protein K0M31_007162, partial [Melipona bicolor]
LKGDDLVKQDKGARGTVAERECRLGCRLIPQAGETRRPSPTSHDDSPRPLVPIPTLPDNYLSR